MLSVKQLTVIPNYIFLPCSAYSTLNNSEVQCLNKLQPQLGVMTRNHRDIGPFLQKPTFLQFPFYVTDTKNHLINQISFLY